MQGWASYFAKMMENLGWPLPEYISGMNLYGPFSFRCEQYFLFLCSLFSPLALSIIVLCTIILFFGMKDSSLLNMTVTIVNVVIILFIIVVGALHFDIKNWSDFFANSEGNSAIGGIGAGKLVPLRVDTYHSRCNRILCIHRV